MYWWCNWCIEFVSVIYLTFQWNCIPFSQCFGISRLSYVAFCVYTYLINVKLFVFSWLIREWHAFQQGCTKRTYSLSIYTFHVILRSIHSNYRDVNMNMDRWNFMRTKFPICSNRFVNESDLLGQLLYIVCALYEVSFQFM